MPALRRRTRRALLLACAAASSGVVVVGPPARPALAATISIRVNNGGIPGAVGVDALYGGQDLAPTSYDAHQYWDANGNLNPPLSVADSNSGRQLTSVRAEVYPNYPYDPWTSEAGGVHGERRTSQGLNFGTVTLPVEGSPGAFRVVGQIKSRTAAPDGRVSVDSFQIGYGFPNDTFADGSPKPQLPMTDTGTEMGSFASTQNRNGQWTMGVAFAGLYTVFIRDNATGVGIQGLMEVYPGAVPDIDLDAICFGLETCSYTSGQPPASSVGSFHALAPTRIADTRTGAGISGGGVRTGDGRSPGMPNPIFRRDETLNHELKVTGVGGVPASGVSAVLLNVTAADQTENPGYLTVFPRPQAIGGSLAVFDDQATYVIGPPNASNLNTKQGENVPNMVVARVGAGGKIRFFNSWGPTNVIVDIAGYFDSGTASSGAEFVGLAAPLRLADSRQPGDRLGGRFSAGDDRPLEIEKISPVPSDATAVVLNVTGAGPAGVGYVTVYPSGQARPNASNLNLNPGRNRANLVVVPVGPDGAIRLAVFETSTDLVVDLFGYYRPGHGLTSIVGPTRVFDSRAGAPFGPGETRTVQVAGINGVPGNARSVIANITATRSTADSYLSVWPSSGQQPPVSTLNFPPGLDVPNLAIIQLSDGALNVFNERGTVDVLVDVLAYTT